MNRLFVIGGIVFMYFISMSSSFAAYNFERDEFGNPRYLNFYAANKLCTSKNKRLPTTRELAEISTEHGSQGIRETLYKEFPIEHELVQAEIKQMRLNDFTPIYFMLNGKVYVDFYFNYSGFINKNNQLYIYGLWADSENPRQTNFAYYYSSEQGFIGSARDLSVKAALCVDKELDVI